VVMGSAKIGTDVIIIGAGPGGYVAAQRCGELGLTTTIVESVELGGSCLNVGCIPSKALINVGDLVHRVKEGAERGIVINGEISIDFAKTQDWKNNKVVKRLTTGVGSLMKAADVEVVRGRGHFVDAHTLQIDIEGGQAAVYTFKYAMIATGSVPVNPSFFPIDGVDVVDSTGALAFTAIPKALVVIGGGVIGVELGQAYAKLGSKVTIVEAMPQLLMGTDPDLIAVLNRKLKRQGIDVYLNAKASGGLVDGKVKVEVESKTIEIEAEKVLVSVGRKPFTEGLDLEKVGVKTNERGFVLVDEQQRTSVPHIFAIGDVCSTIMLAHKASAEGIVAAEVIAGRNSAANWRTIPTVIFTDPEIAQVGLTDAQAKERGFETIVSKQMFAAIGRALTMGETDGLVKLVADKKTGVLLGAQLAGPEVSELIGEMTLAIEMGALVEDVALTPHYHPTLSEGIFEAARHMLVTIEKGGKK
jgi:dihydrolipoamide dehydrogenase